MTRRNGPASFPAGVVLAVEEHEQEQNFLNLLVAQL